jgi:two-component sensor histidine kinase
MDSERCWRLGMIVSELITNAARHAFRNCGGVIRVELSSSESFVACRVMDNGTVDKDVRPGRGLKIVEALTKELAGNVNWSFGPHGVRSVITFPVNS